MGERIDFDDLGNKYIMPAGNVFNFTGVDVDDEGNLYAHVSYALDTSGVGKIVPKK